MDETEDDDVCSNYIKYVKHVRCENLKFNKTEIVADLEWGCSIETKKKFLKLSVFKIECDGYTFEELPDDSFEFERFLGEFFNPKSCFLRYTLKNVNLVKLENKINLINTGVILACSTSSLIAVFTIFLAYTQFKDPSFKPPASADDSLPTVDSSLDSPTINTSFVFLNNIDKNIGRFTKQISTGFASANFRSGGNFSATQSEVASTSFR